MTAGDTPCPAVLRYFLEYQWFVDFSVYASAVYAFSEGYFCLLGPARETNLGVLWCLLTVFFCLYPHGGFVWGGQAGEGTHAVFIFHF